MKVESIEAPGKCISDDASELTDCSSANVWEYYYDPNFARLKRFGSTHPQCLARKTKKPLTDLPENLPTGLMDCGPDDVSNSQFYLTILGGDEANVFQWAKINVLTGLPSATYCITIPQQESGQQLCGDNLDDEMHWRRYDTVIDATEISVKPDLLLNKITDPEVLFQLFLFSAEGKSSRKLRALSAGLYRDVSRISPIIDFTVNVVSESLALVSTVGDEVESISDGTSKAESSFKSLSIILKIFQNVPKVRKVIKTIKLPTITKQVSRNHFAALLILVYGKLCILALPYSHIHTCGFLLVLIFSSTRWQSA